MNILVLASTQEAQVTISASILRVNPQASIDNYYLENEVVAALNDPKVSAFDLIITNMRNLSEDRVWKVVELATNLSIPVILLGKVTHSDDWIQEVHAILPNDDTIGLQHLIREIQKEMETNKND